MTRIGTRRALAVGVTTLAVCAAALATVARPLPAAAASPTVYYFHGTSADDACRAQVNAGTSQPCAFFDTNTPTQTSALGFTQTPGVSGNPNQSANLLSVYWYGNFSGTVSGGLYLDWYWSGPNPSLGLTITVFADPNPLIATTNTKIAQGAVSLNVGATPTLNHTLLPLAASCPCSVTSKLLIQATPSITSAGPVYYDSTAVPSDFFFAPVVTATSTATVGSGVQAFSNYDSPSGFQTLDAAQRQNAGEPSIGSDWKTGKIMYMAGTQVSQIGFDTSHVPPAVTWNDVTPLQLANVSEDSILFTNSATNRTFAEDFLLNSGCNANMAVTDTDGGPGGGPTNPTTNINWTPAQCPFAQGPDHPSVGAGPYHGAAPPTAADTQQIVYYCAQNVAVVAGAECSNSQTGGLTWSAPTHLFGAGTPCNSIHGHIRVSPDGTMYVPQGSCSGHQGMALTQDNGSTFNYSVVSDAAAGATDPSVAADKANTLYFGYQDGSVTSHPKIAVSHDHGTTWSPSVDVSAPFGIQNAVFPEVIAGDAGRAAFAFLGTTTPGDYQLSSFKGVWYLYIAFTYDGGNSWSVVNATPFDPVQRGCVDNGGATGGTYAGCRNMLDFNDITVDKQGRVYVAYTDGCTTDPNNTYSCDTNPAITDPTVSDGCDTSGNGAGIYSEKGSEYSTATCTYGRQSALVRQVCGKGLFASHDSGFFEGPTCSVAPNTPEAPMATALVVVGGGAVGLVGMVVRRRRRRTAELA